MRYPILRLFHVCLKTLSCLVPLVLVLQFGLLRFQLSTFQVGLPEGPSQKKQIGSFPTEWGPSLLAKLVYNSNSVDTYNYLLLGGLEHEFYFSIYWE